MQVALSKASEAYRLLNEYLGDLIVGIRILELFEKSSLFTRQSTSMRVLLRRMCLSHLVLTLAKWGELYDRYKAVFPSDVRDACRKLKKEIDRRGVRNFRNTVVGHSRDDKLRRPLTVAEINDCLGAIIGDSIESFSAWINNPTTNNFPETVVAICERVRDRIAEENGLKKKS